MKLSDLQNKIVINLFDGKQLGKIIDVNVSSDGKIETLIVEKHRFIISYFSSKNEINVYWNQIDKIGEDVILVNIVY